MYVTQGSGDINVILHKGEMQRLKTGETLTRDLINSGTLKSLDTPVHVKLGKTTRPNIDIKVIPRGSISTEADKIKITINDGYAYRYLAEKGPTFGVLSQSRGTGGLVNVTNQYWAKEE